MAESTKVCKKCGEPQSLSEYGEVKGKNGQMYKVGTCKSCTAKYKAAKHQEHKEEEYARLKERRKVNHDENLKKYAEGKDKINETRRKNYDKNRDGINENRREKRT